MSSREPEDHANFAKWIEGITNQRETMGHKPKSGHGITITTGGIISATVALLIMIAVPIVGCPYYKVWKRGMDGKAKLRKAEQDRKILIEEARAKEVAAKHLAKAEHALAKGVAQAIDAIGAKLKGYPEYNHWRWVEGLHDGSSEVIYVPTEANLPILEANRRKP